MADKKLITLNDMFGITPSNGEIVDIPVGDLVAYKRHEFKPSPQAKRQATLESIKEFGILEPIIVRPKKDVPYDLAAPYEILAGHQRTELGKLAGLSTIPAFVKEGLSEDEAYQIHSETNWPRWEEMAHSDRASMLASHYEALQNRNVRKEVLSEINSYLQTLSNPVNTRAEEGLSLLGTSGIRGVASECDLSKNTIARYIRINTLSEDIKSMLDDDKLGIYAAVELSYISQENQKLFVDLMQTNEYRCDIKKAKLIRELQMKAKLTIATMTEVLSGNKAKKNPGKPKSFSISGKVMKKYEQYFSPDQDKKEIENVIDKALELYFSSRNE